MRTITGWVSKKELRRIKDETPKVKPVKAITPDFIGPKGRYPIYKIGKAQETLRLIKNRPDKEELSKIIFTKYPSLNKANTPK